MISNKVNQKKSFFRLMTGRIEYFTWKGKYKTARSIRIYKDTVFIFKCFCTR